MNLPPPPQDDDPIITQFKPVNLQWELTDDNINRIDPENGHTILHNYWQNINTTPLEVYRYLIETKGCDINAQDKYKDTPLIYALRYVEGGNIPVLTYLLSRKDVNANIKGKWRYTILHTACGNMNYLPLEVFKLLIETHGADVNAQDNSNNTPLHHALRTFNLNYGGNITVLTYLLTHKTVNIHIKNNSGYTLLHVACQHINELPIDVFKALIEIHGVDVNVQDNSKDTPLHCALRDFNPNYGDITALTDLINHKGVNVNIRGERGYTILHTACDKINSLSIEIFKLLIETHGADVNARANNNDIPLHCAIRNFNPDNRRDITVLRYLLNQNNIHAKHSNGHNLLHYACMNNHYLSRNSVELNSKYDTISCQIVEVIVEICIQQILDGIIS
jgi:ankyrin repeat protein